MSMKCRCVCECDNEATTDNGSGVPMCAPCRNDYLGIKADPLDSDLRALAAEAHAAHVYLDESAVNAPDAPPQPLADRIAQIVGDLEAAQARIAELEAMLIAMA